MDISSFVTKFAAIRRGFCIDTGRFMGYNRAKEVSGMEKSALRALIREKKRALTDAQIAYASERLAQALFDHPMYRRATAL